MPSKVGDSWTARVMIGGQRFTRRGFPTKAEAKEWEILRKKDLSTEFTPKPGNSVSLIDLCVAYLKYSKRFSLKTLQEKKFLCKRILVSFGNNTITDITAQMVQDFLDERANEASSNASNKDRKNLLAMFRYCNEIMGEPHNPVRMTKQMAHDVQPQYTPPEPDVLKMLAVASPDEQIFLTCYLSTGARRAEIFRLTWDDVNFNARTLRLGTKKSRDGSMKYRTLSMNSRLYETLQRQYKIRDKKSPYVFTFEKTGQPYKYRQKLMKGLCKRAGIRQFGFHALRRYVASILSDKHKVSSKAIQNVLGHESQSTTEKYLQKIHTGMAEVMELLGDAATNDATKLFSNGS